VKEETDMPFNFEIDGDWDESSKAYDKKTPKTLKLDDSGPSNPNDLHDESIEDKFATAGFNVVSDDVRIKQIEAVTRQVLAKLKAIEEKLGWGKEP
jgi:hypothetical protein